MQPALQIGFPTWHILPMSIAQKMQADDFEADWIREMKDIESVAVTMLP